MATCAMTGLLKEFPHVSAACCHSHFSFQAKWAAAVSLTPSNTLKLSPGVEAARRYLQTVLSGFGSLLEQTVEYALEQCRAENY